MKKYKLTSDDCSSIANCLRLAAERYDSNAREIEEHHANYGGLEAQFTEQAKVARTFADLFDACDGAVVEMEL